MKNHPKGQMKERDTWEGPNSTFVAQSPSSGNRDSNLSVGTAHSVDAKHTASWENGATLTVKRNG